MEEDIKERAEAICARMRSFARFDHARDGQLVSEVAFGTERELSKFADGLRHDRVKNLAVTPIVDPAAVVAIDDGGEFVDLTPDYGERGWVCTGPESMDG